MARDRLIPKYFSELGRFGTPTLATLATVGAMIVLILLFNVESVAKLASAFQLLLFGILNVAVIVMRESEIEGYDPGFKSPWYPYMQIAGIFISGFLIAEMGFLSIAFTLVIATISVIWYFSYAQDKVKRQGAIYHVHARLGQYQYEGLEREMRGIMREKGLRKEDPYEKAIGRSLVFDIEEKVAVESVTDMVCAMMAERADTSKKLLVEMFTQDPNESVISVGHSTALKHVRIDNEMDTEVALVRLKNGLKTDSDSEEEEKFHCLIYLASSTNKSGQHLRILAHLAEMIDNIDFEERWLNASDIAGLREILLRDERFINITVRKGSKTEEIIGKQIKELDEMLPGESLITMVKREGDLIFPHGDTVLQAGDELSIIGEKKDIEQIKERSK
jgi:mannitol/fructose-specific phosphotransferase system IIA component (Ntr-type)